ncbi:IclR family transcriptional regulator [Halomarina halobia]|uniref:IclR family transcriptional regulator n=1 Tax=Halomarina halobia TaxID=3033386 RepID=A0ABD6ADB1_9EURY|nr:IclR family transcriptional regulator [Halomarina sp. PSR21]
MHGDAKTIESVNKTLYIIEGLWKLDSAGVTELAEHLDLSKSTVHVHLTTLEKKGYVVSADGQYELGLRFVNYGEYVKRSQPLYQAAKPAVEDLAKQTGELVFCWVEQEGLATALCAEAGERAVQTNIRVGTHTYMHGAAAGKAILAYLPDDRVEAILDRWGMSQLTEHTITDREQLRKQLEKGRERGVFFSQHEYRRGVASIGVPIRGEECIHGSLTVYGPAMRITKDQPETELANQLLSSANQIEVDMTVG